MNQTPQLDNRNDPGEPLVLPQTENLKAERSLSDRILGYSLAASVLINLGWMVWVSNSDLFGKGGVVPPLKETQVKIWKRPLPPKPKKIVKPPPPPPKQKPPPPKQKPLPHIVHPRPTPPQHHVNVAVHTTHSQVSTSRISMPTQEPSTEPVTPAVPNAGPPTPEAPPTPTPEPTPTPQVVAPPAPKPAPPAPKPTPPPAPVYDHNHSPIASQEALPIGDYAQPSLPSDLDPSTLSSKSVTISYEIDENGHVSHPRVTHSCGNSDVDQACVDAIRQTRFQPAIQDHEKLRQPASYTFNLN